MKKIEVISNDQVLDGEKIRYIEYQGIKYIIYTLNEVDEEDYEKLYMNKIVENEEDLISDNNWNELKNIIPTIVREIKNNEFVTFKDLDINEIDKVNKDYSRAFKLKVDIINSIKKDDGIESIDSELTNLLNEINKQEEDINNLDAFLDEAKEESNLVVPISPNDSKSVELEQLKDEVNNDKEIIERLQNKVSELEIENNKYKNMINEIKIMLEKA